MKHTGLLMPVGENIRAGDMIALNAGTGTIVRASDGVAWIGVAAQDFLRDDAIFCSQIDGLFHLGHRPNPQMMVIATTVATAAPVTEDEARQIMQSVIETLAHGVSPARVLHALDLLTDGVPV